MARLIHPSPSPAPSAKRHKTLLFLERTPRGQLMRIEVYVLFTVFLLVLLFFLGRTRRFMKVGYFTKSMTRVIYMLIPVAITYIMGLMHSAPTVHTMYPVWACALIYAYGGVITMTACRFKDNDDTLSYLLRTLPLLFWTAWLATTVVLDEEQTLALVSLAIVLAGFLMVSMFNTWETMKAFYLASKSKGLRTLVEPIVEHMHGFTYDEDAQARAGGHGEAGDTARWCNFVIWGSPREGDQNANVTTTENICTLVGREGGFLVRYSRVGKLRDLCLSYAFFRLILRRFADCPMYEMNEPEQTRRFMLDMLQGDSAERVFRVIEVELRFLFEFFYTKTYVSNNYTWIHMWRAPTLAALLFFSSTIGLSSLPPAANTQSTVNFSVNFRGHSMDVGVTRVVILIFSLLELWKSVMLHFSNRRMVGRLCTFRRTRLSWITEKWIALIWDIKEYATSSVGGSTCVSLFKPWQRRLGQYSFLENRGKVPFLGRDNIPRVVDKVVNLRRVGQTGDFSVQLHAYVKTAVIESLRRHLQLQLQVRTPLSRGTATLARYGLSPEITRECELLPEAPNAYVYTNAHVILVWHIATSHCGVEHPPVEIGDDNMHFLVATQLSKYCAYLLTFVPKLLPDLLYTTQHVSDIAHTQAVESPMNAARQNGSPAVANHGERAGTPNLTQRGRELADSLAAHVFGPAVQRPERWKVLAEFWAELLLYLAPSDNVTAHGEYLARGGEFITHVWALLTHACILARDRNPVAIAPVPAEEVAAPVPVEEVGACWQSSRSWNAPVGVIQPDQSTNLESRHERRGSW